MRYKPDQGRLARMAVFWLVFLLVFYGCMALRYQLDAWTPDGMRAKLFALPVVGDVSWNVAVSLLVIPGLTAGLLIRYLNKAKIADFLIETEGELRKVAWPSFDETRRASIIVIICVIILMTYLAGSDFLLGRLFNHIWAFGA